MAMAAFGGIMQKALASPQPDSQQLHRMKMVLLSPPLSYDLRQERRKQNMLLYYDTASEAEVMSRTAVSLFRGASSADVEAMAGCELLLMVAELDPNEIVDGNLEFVQAYRARFSRMPRFEVMMGHNHISNTLGIGLPDDAVGKRILEFVRE